ncbi:hypothetical protein D3C86_1428050 [compost metagenome]
MSCIEKIKESEKLDEIIINSLWNNAIVTYGKIFTRSKNGFASLVMKQCIKDEFVDIHSEVIDLRNQFVAHREENEMETGVLLVGQHKKNGFVGFEYHLPVVMKNASPIKDILIFKRLINDLENYVNERLIENLQKIDERLWAEISDIKQEKNREQA